MEGAAVAYAKEAGDNDAEGADTPGETSSVKSLASFVEGAAVADTKEAGAPDSERASTPVDAGSDNNVAEAEGMACSLEASAVANAEKAGDAVEVVDKSVDTWSAKHVAAANDITAAKGVASAVANAKYACSVEDFDRVLARCSVEVAAATYDNVAATDDKGVDASVDATAVDSTKGTDYAK